MDALVTPTAAHVYPRRIAGGQLAALVASASAALAAQAAAAPAGHPLAALGRQSPAPEPGRGAAVDAAA